MSTLREVLPGPLQREPLRPHPYCCPQEFLSSSLPDAPESQQPAVFVSYFHKFASPLEITLGGGTVLVSGGQHGQKMHWDRQTAHSSSPI